MTWGYTAVAGATLVGGYLASQSANRAASGASSAAASANALSDAQFQQTRTDMAPWRNAGGSAIGQLSYLLGLPGYGPANAPVRGTLGNGLTPEGRTPLPQPQQLATIGMRPNKYGVEGWTPKDQFAPEGGLAQQMSMEDQGGGGNLGSSGGGGNFDYNPTTGEWTPTATPGGTYNAQLGDFGSLSRDFGMADFQADPGYEFRMKQGQQALERSAAAGGRYLGGGTLKALTRYGQDMGSQEYGNAFNGFQKNRNTRFNQLAAVSGIGQTANGQLAQLGSMNATTQGNNLMGAATVGGNAAMAGAAGWNTALNNGVNNWLTYRGSK